MNTDKDAIDRLIKQFFEIFANKDGGEKDWTTIYRLCIPETLIIKKEGLEQVVYNVKAFIDPRMILLTNGSITGFEEHETEEATVINRNIAQRFCRYRKTGFKNGQYFDASGTKLFHLVKMAEGWKIGALTWEDDL